jgi:hypothetical protein
MLENDHISGHTILPVNYEACRWGNICQVKLRLDCLAYNHIGRIIKLGGRRDPAFGPSAAESYLQSTPFNLYRIFRPRIVRALLKELD